MWAMKVKQSWGDQRIQRAFTMIWKSGLDWKFINQFQLKVQFIWILAWYFENMICNISIVLERLKVSKWSRRGYSSVCIRKISLILALKIRFVKFDHFIYHHQRLVRNYHITIMAYTVLPSHTHYYYYHNSIHFFWGSLAEQTGNVSLTA